MTGTRWASRIPGSAAGATEGSRETGAAMQGGGVHWHGYRRNGRERSRYADRTLALGDLPRPGSGPTASRPWPGLSPPGRPASATLASLETRGVACAAADDLRLLLGEVDHRGRFGAAVAGVDHRVQGVLELLGDLPSVGHGLVLIGQQQGARDERLTELGEQRLGHDVAGDPGPAGLFSRGLQLARP